MDEDKLAGLRFVRVHSHELVLVSTPWVEWGGTVGVARWHLLRRLPSQQLVA